MDNLRVATVPGSKSITNRALLLAALSGREYLLQGAQFSDDSRYFLGALKALGFAVREDEVAKTVRITGTGGRVPKKNAEIYVGSAGTAARFLTAMLALSDGIYTIRASEQMARRPMKPLFEALSALGAEFTWLGEEGHLPVRVKGIFADVNCTSGMTQADEDSTGGKEESIRITDADMTQAVVDPVKEDPVNGKSAGKIFTDKSSTDHFTDRSNRNGITNKKRKVRPTVELDISESTQYLSALLMTASMLPDGLTIHITSEKKCGSYIEITRRMMSEFGIRTEFDGENYVAGAPAEQPMVKDKSCTGSVPSVNCGNYTEKKSSVNTEKCVGKEAQTKNRCGIEEKPQSNGGCSGKGLPSEAGYSIYQIEPDVSAACYFYAAAMLTGGSVQVRHVHRDSMQGDMKFLGLLEQMGATVEDLPDGICVTAHSFKETTSEFSEKTIRSEETITNSDEKFERSKETIPNPGEERIEAERKTCNLAPEAETEDARIFPGLQVNMNDFSDQAITLAALAPFASSPTVISGIAHIRRQESDRLHGIAENLARMGIRAEEAEDSIKIWPGTPKPCEIETYDDHRMAMGFALVGLRIPGMTIKNPQCCQKTFKEFFEEMEKVFGLKFLMSDEAQ